MHDVYIVNSIPLFKKNVRDSKPLDQKLDTMEYIRIANNNLSNS